MSESSDRHPLEGKYIIFNYGVQDHADEGWALALYKLINDKLEGIYFPEPANSLGDMSSIGDRNIEELIKLMLERGIKKVYSVFHLDDFFGIPFGFVSLHEPDEEPEEVELWSEWKSLSKDGYEHNRLKSEGIDVLFWDEARRVEY